MSKKGATMVFQIVITMVILLALAALILVWVIPKYIGGGIGQIGSFAPDKIETCQTEGLMEASKGRPAKEWDDDMDGSPNWCDACKSKEPGKCDDRSDNDNDGLPSECDKDDNDPEEKSCTEDNGCDCPLLKKG